MTAEREPVRIREPVRVEGPFTFTVESEEGKPHRQKIGITVPVLIVLYMDEAIKKGYFANRSDFVSQALAHFIEFLREKIELDKLVKADVQSFYAFLTGEQEPVREPVRVEGPFTFTVKSEEGKSHRQKIGITVPPLTVLYMDKAIDAGYFANRSDFVSQALAHFIEFLREKIELDKLLKADVQSFYAFMFKEKQ